MLFTEVIKWHTSSSSSHPSHLLAYTAAMKLLHPNLPLASLWMVPQLWFIFFVSASTVLHQVVFGRPCFCLPSEVQWTATLVMELASLHSMCPIQQHHFLVMMVSISSCWHHAKRSWLEMVLGQKMSWIFLRLVMLKDDSLARSSVTHRTLNVQTSRCDEVFSIWIC